MNPPPYTGPPGSMMAARPHGSYIPPPLPPPQQGMSTQGMSQPGLSQQGYAPQLPPQQSVLPNGARPARPAGSVREERPVSTEYQGYIWSLKIVQQPQRARMCGFGDKDRRPITPPPAVLLVVTDPKTGRVLSPDDLEGVDCSYFIVNVDLWDESKINESSLVRANANSPSSSISSATTTAYPPTSETVSRGPLMMMGGGPDGGYYAAAPGYPMHSAYGGMVAPGPYGNTYGMPNTYGYQTMMGGAAGLPYYGAHAPQSNSNFTRNLIGSLSVNATRLNNEHGEPGFYFVFQDLSVRMEGNFRLRMNFTNLSDGSNPPSINKGTCPILCWVFTEPFKVYSAKKFPGVIESTPLSKCFAGQGIKIPIRKDNGRNDSHTGADGGGDDDDAE